MDLNLPEHAFERRRDGRISIVLHRSVAVADDVVVEVRNARSTVWLPAIVLAAVLGAGAWIAQSAGALPFWLMVVLLIFCVLGAPLAVMGLIGALFGADLVADRRKGSVTFQQGFLGMGVGTKELVPFPRIARFEVTIEGEEPDRWRGQTDSVRQFALVLEKDNGRRLVVARLPVPASRQEEAMDRILATGQALSSLTGARVDIPAGWKL
ncbi:MAG: hypothetical protein ACE5EF_13780, partial [Dehalococcoidia bacterium]